LETWYNQGLILLSGLISNPTVSVDSISIWYVIMAASFFIGMVN